MKKLTSILFIAIILLQVCSFAQNKTKPKNIIIMIGDGMGLTHISSSLISEDENIFKKFKSIGLSITCSADNLITDSAAGATAIACGYKTNNHYIGVDPNNIALQNIFEVAKKYGKSTGLVATSTITHATPAGFYAHISDRGNELVIADQLLKSNVDVIIGGGLANFIPKKKGGKRIDGQDLTNAFSNIGYELFTNYSQLKKYSTDKKILGLLNKEAIVPANKRSYSLGNLTSIAIDKLSQNKDGFVLMVEGSQIDWGAHANNKTQVVTELADFQKAIDAAFQFAEKDGNTLVIITSDHETGGLSLKGTNRDIDSIKFNFSTKDHSPACVGIFAFGPGEEEFRGIMENIIIGRKLFSFFDSSISWKK